MKFKFDYFRRGLLMLTLVAMASFAWAQRTVVGTVNDGDTGEPLIGASIFAPGTDAGTVTDFDGKYSIDVPSGVNTLEFSYTGYATQTVQLGASNVVNVKLAAGAVLDEVVVIGYGSVKKSDLTGAVASIGEKDFNNGLMVTSDQLIQGQTPGVQITANSGQPGGATTVRIRGNSSFRAGNDPLYVVDGVQLGGASSKPDFNIGSDIGNSPAANPLNFLNPNEIESISILKDASATAIYGSRGANGVIIISTKKGKKGEPTAQFNTSVGVSNIQRKYDVLSGDEYRDALARYPEVTGGDFGSDVDAFDEILRTGIIQNHGVSIGGGSDNGNYRIGLGYLDQEGIIKNNGLNRLSANIGGGYKFLENNNVGLDFNMIAARTNENGVPIGTSSGARGSLISNALQWNPTHPLYDGDGNPIIDPDFGDFVNPVALLDNYKSRTNTTDLLASISPWVKFTDNLTYRFNYGVTAGTGQQRGQLSPVINVQDVRDRGLAWISNGSNTNQILTHTLNWTQDLSSNLGLNLIGGYEYQKFDERASGISGRDFLNSDLVNDLDFTGFLNASSRGSREIFAQNNPSAELQSFFARGIFDFNNRFLVTATVRSDASSRFGADNRTGIFPSVAFGWNLHNESFLEGSTFNELKFRASWGQTGNSSIPTGRAQTQYRFDNDGGLFSAINQNPNLTWETSTTFNIGLDYALMDYRLTGSLEYFNRNNSNFLFSTEPAFPGPPSLKWINFEEGNIVNQGVELGLNADIVRGKNFNWDLGLFLSFLDNQVKNYTGPNFFYQGLFGQGSSGATVGRIDSDVAIHSFYVREFNGLDDKGVSQIGKLEDGRDKFIYFGDPNPDMLLGLRTNLSFGDLSLGINMNGAFGHQLYNNTLMSVTNIGNLGSRNISGSLLEGDVLEAKSNAIQSSSRYVEDADYLKIANVTLAYNLGNIGNSVKGLNVFITGQNLATFTSYSGFDPEVNTVNVAANGIPSFGVDYIGYPTARNFLVGANFSF